VRGPVHVATPWDIESIVGLCVDLGFASLAVTEGGRLAPWAPGVSGRETVTLARVLVIHDGRLGEVYGWREGG